MSNALKNETSPYLRQHAENPVDWLPWSDEVFEKAKKEDKLVIVSIGYSSCHWCHVMAYESFEDEEAAKVMNNNFLCVKIDREENPDIDHYYMDAVQLMTGRGGWPLNCITLPCGKPIYGGTYFPKDRWVNILQTLLEGYETDKKKFIDYAENLENGIAESNLIFIDAETTQSKINLEKAVLLWKQRFDGLNGGSVGAPKFPMPCNLDFLLRYAHSKKDEDILRHVLKTLDKMAFGGIYDHIGGGFFRYSTDAKWKVPHFEKMLYDNAQLISVYAQAYKKTKKRLYREVVEQSISFCERNFQSEEGLFFSALDADSNGVEGGFYIWKEAEVKLAAKKYFDLTKEYYNLNDKGFWELGNFILLRNKTDEDFAFEHKLGLEEWKELKAQINRQLLDARSAKQLPGLDNKSIVSWNAMMVKAYIDVYRALGNENCILKAKDLMQTILTKAERNDKAIFHIYTDGEAKINGFLEDYAWCISACISLYESTFEMQWLDKANVLMEYAKKHFLDEENRLFFFSEKGQNDNILRKIEVMDNVIPSSNSVMAMNIFKLGHLFDDNEAIELTNSMLKNIRSTMESYISNMANWASLYLMKEKEIFEIAVVGKNCKEKLGKIQQNYIPNAIFCGTEHKQNKIPLLEDKYVENETLIYVCRNRTCKAPTSSVSKAIALVC